MLDEKSYVVVSNTFTKYCEGWNMIFILPCLEMTLWTQAKT